MPTVVVPLSRLTVVPEIAFEPIVTGFSLMLTFCPAVAVNVNFMFCPGTVLASATPAPPAVIAEETSAGTV